MHMCMCVNENKTMYNTYKHKSMNIITAIIIVVLLLTLRRVVDKRGVGRALLQRHLVTSNMPIQCRASREHFAT